MSNFAIVGYAAFCVLCLFVGFAAGTVVWLTDTPRTDD
jgi:hypothetical protein